MGDSEDEYDRKRRDKFRGERTESYPRGDSRRGGGTDERRRDDWIDRESWGSRNRQRTDYRDYRGGGGRERYSPAHSQDMVQPMKRMKTEWEDRRSGGYGHDGGGYGGGYRSWGQDSYPPQHNYGGHMNNQRDMPSVETQPPMMSFKMFLQTQDDNITDEEAIKKYNEYKLEFKRQQLNEFFMAHKDEEWFKIKYHPEDSVKRKEEQMDSLRNRVKVFMEFLDNGRLDKVSLDGHQSEQLLNLLDAVVIRLEGGTDFDLTVLEDEKPAPGGSSEEQPAATSVAATGSSDQPAERPKSPAPKLADKKESDDELDTGDKDAVVLVKESSEPLQEAADQDDDKAEQKSEKSDKSDKSVKSDKSAKSAKSVKSMKSDKSDKSDKFYKSDKSDKSDKSEKSDKSDDSDNDSPDEEPPPPGIEGDQSDEDDTVLAKLKVAEVKQDSKKRKRSESAEPEPEPEPEEIKSDVEMEDISDKEDSSLKLDKLDNEDEEDPKKAEGEGDAKAGDKPSVPEEPKPRPLHRTVSIFLRTLAPSITKQEVEAMCKRYPGYMRVAIADPQPERKWFRRGWVTFERHVNIKEICWNLNNIRLRDCELGAIVNRDLSRRIRTVNGITVHKQVVRHDIKLSARIVHNLDSRNALWCDGDTPAEPAPRPEDTSVPSFGLVSRNPVLKNITDYLIEEASAEEDELLGQAGEHEDGQLADDSGALQRDEALIKVLDRLLLYLRVVHSVDYYYHCEYPNEDEMPNRCGIMHIRATPPSSKVTPQEISDYCRTFENKVSCFLQPPAPTRDDDYDKLGCKDPDVEVEKFIQANTQELAKDKWLCPLSGKKFKGPEFVRKHIFNKHAEKVEEVKKEVEYFNNYLRDPRRPQLPEHPGKRHPRDGPDQNFPSPGPYMPPYQYNNYGRHMNYGGHPYGGGYGYGHGYGRPNRGFNRGRGGGDYRPVIHYRDLDAPRDIEEII